MQNKLISYSLIFILIIPFFGFNFLIGLLGNILLLVFLIPLLLLILGLLGLNLFKSNIKLCESCGSTIIGNNDNCPYCGYELIKNTEKSEDYSTDASNKTIEIKAEEIN
tara:strand:+ start:816 stop:1142 length:327 start_codon:yes stop_codon:yes gene_type:complete